ncbi:MAG: Hsp20/alpha crystallin family protein [Syntrophaceae bacterium]|nr:Hsp20/alpha crystallin family protein [Syntrophaceae bacterium]
MAVIRLQSNAEEGTGLSRLHQEVNQLFNLFSAGADPFFSRVYPAVNLTEEGDNIYVRAELPGVSPESLDISVVEGRLQIRGERKIVLEEQNASYHRRERESGIFRRTIALPTRVDPGKVSASMKNGVLTILLPKSEEAKPKKITVKTA